MIFTLDLKKMTVQEKLQLIELIQNDLQSSAASIPMPEWHKDVLRQSEEDIKAGRDQFMDLDEAKKEIMKEFNESKITRKSQKKLT